MTAKRPISLAEHLQLSGRHPVIVFGATASGKTMMLVSLIEALNRSELVDVCLGAPILPENHPEAAETRKMAKAYFDAHAFSMAQGELLPSTQVQQPLLIPIDIARRDRGTIRLALLEVRGEWFMPIKQGTETRFPEFPSELAEIVELYGGSLSVIWVAPYCLVSTDDSDLTDSDFALVGALAEYRRRRRSMARDAHLFMLAKWDCVSSPVDDDTFGKVPPSRVRSILEERYPNAWPRFLGLALGSTGRRFFMQYSAAYVVDGSIRVPPYRHQRVFERYPRTVLNWLYGNATELDSHIGGLRVRLQLFPEVLAQPGTRLSRPKQIARSLAASWRAR